MRTGKSGLSGLITAATLAGLALTGCGADMEPWGEEVESTRQAVTITQASYDGTYAPSSTTPPSGQTTWLVYDSVTLGNIVPNSPSSGVAHFNDDSTTGRLAIWRTFSTADNLANLPWTYKARLKVSKQTGTATAHMVFGVRDEGGAGRTIMLGIDPDTGHLSFCSSPLTSRILISNKNYEDGLQHRYEVRKYLSGSSFKVQVYVDDVAMLATPLDYTSFWPDPDNRDGFGYYTSTPGTSDVELSHIELLSC